uniref:Uncharacterized protein n=1 Tax=Timema bartmani TaxID=61472 RepID=A0A7R9EYS7_9NEOP|nr:unnamed protein product [Timema bartmani]
MVVVQLAGRIVSVPDWRWFMFQGKESSCDHQNNTRDTLMVCKQCSYKPPTLVVEHIILETGIFAETVRFRGLKVELCCLAVETKVDPRFGTQFHLYYRCAQKEEHGKNMVDGSRDVYQVPEHSKSGVVRVRRRFRSFSLRRPPPTPLLCYFHHSWDIG